MPQQVSKARGLTVQQKLELWAWWKREQSLSEIGRALGKHAGAITGCWLYMVALPRWGAPDRREC
jgi:hypothetical protein